MFQIKLLLCNVVLWLSLLPEAIRYIISFLLPKRAQKKVLMRILNKMNMSESEFNKQPVTQYADYVSQIEILKKQGVHPTYHEDVSRLCPTSGTSGTNKLIPYTKSLKSAFQAGLYPWIFFMYLRFPSLFFKRQYWSVTPVIQTQSDDVTSKIKIGFEDDEEYVGWLQQLIIKTVWINTKELAKSCSSVEMFLSRISGRLSHEKNLGLVSVWSPSLLSLLVNKHGSVLPNNLVLSSWAHGYSEGESAGVVNTTGARLQPKGLLSTEACVTIPLGTKTFLFSYNSHYFEFRNILSEKLETVTTLEVGHEYEVIVTTQSGFVRYATGDIVKVTKKVFGRPSCAFIKRTGVSDLFGEKLDESIVERLVGELLIGTKVENAFWFLSPTKNANGAMSYTLFVASQVVNTAFARILDNHLRKLYHYDYCRSLGQLAEARVFIIEDVSPEVIFINTSSSVSNARFGDIKICRLSNKTDWHKVFSGHFL